jgi:hypothetical protein
MKKLLLLLLILPYLAIAQSADATPIENILLTNAAEKSAATRVTVQDATTKELGFILKSTLNTNISIGNKNQNTFQILSSTGSGPVVPSVTTTESGLSTASDKVLINTIAHTGATGLNQGGLLAINTDAAKFDLSAGFGYVVNGHYDPDNTTYTKVTWTAKIANVIPNLATQKQTYIAIDINGDLFLTNAPLTATQRRNYIRIGVLIHLNNSEVTYIDNQPTVNIEIGGQVQDILEALGFRSLSGNRVFPVSNNLKIKKELGRVFKSGANFDNLTTQPHSFTLAAQEPITFRYRTQTGAEGSDITDITPAIYDLNGTITPVGATATLATIQRVYIFQDGVIRIQPGQRVFTTLNAAITALNSDVFVTDLDIAENGLYLGAIVLTRNTVDLSNISQAIFAPSIGTTANGSVASPALGYTAENVANKQNSLLVDGTGAKYTTVDAVNAGLNTKSDDNNVVKLTGAQTVEGIKEFKSTLTRFYNSNSAVALEIRSNLLNIPSSSTSSIIGTTESFSGNLNGDLILQSRTGIGKIQFFSDGIRKMVMLNSGFFGFGLLAPTEVIDVVGNGKFSGTLTASSFNGSAALTGTPTAPTATAGTNTTQIATTAYVLANSTNIPQLEFNNGDLTVWNNGKGNLVSNTMFGESSGSSTTTGDSNSFYARNSGRSNTTGFNNSFYAVNSGFNNTTGFNNCFFGLNSGRNIGDGVTANTNSSSSLFIGNDTKALADNQNNQIVIGNSATGAGSNSVTIGNTSNTRTILRGVLTVGTTTNYADNSAAIAAGLTVGQVYRTGDLLKIVN